MSDENALIIAIWKNPQEDAPRLVYADWLQETGVPENVARAECRHGQSSTVDRSNYRSLHRLYPDVWTDLSYSNVTVLGAFVADLTPDLVNTLIGLRCEYAVLDESDYARIGVPS